MIHFCWTSENTEVVICRQYIARLQLYQLYTRVKKCAINYINLGEYAKASRGLLITDKGYFSLSVYRAPESNADQIILVKGNLRNCANFLVHIHYSALTFGDLSMIFI
jgi:hypothetical protein